jgi:hypothetical protein
MTPDLYERKLGFGEIFKASWVFFFNNFKYLFVFGFVLAAVLKGLDYLVFISFPSVPDDKIVVGQLKALVTVAFGFVPYVSVVFIIRQRLAGQQVSLAGIIEFLRKIFWSAFLIHMLSQLVSSLYWLPGTLFRLSGVDSILVNFFQFASALVGVSLMVYFAFVFQAFILRKQTVFFSFAYSFRTVKGCWWKIFGTIVLLVLGMAVPCLALVLFLKRIFSIATYWTVPFSTLIGMYMTVFFTILFLNIDRGKEALSPVDPVIPSEKLL